jgi:alkaline phosphatase D
MALQASFLSTTGGRAVRHLKLTRRDFARSAAIGAALASAPASAARIARPSMERRDLFPQGVASGDPTFDSVILWTRRPPVGGSRASRVTVEVAGDEAFTKIVSTGSVDLSPATDWTARFLATRLKPHREYWYRFVDDLGFASRVGRTITAPADDAQSPVRFAFASCQMVSEGACNAYRKMIFEDKARPADQRLQFVLHLGDFIYEVIFYPEQTEGGVRRGRRLRDLFKFPQGQKIGDFHIPATLEDYRTVYRAYLEDPDLQDARARWPFVCVWDNHEFSWTGYQSQQVFGGKVIPAQRRRVAANQAWWEYIPAHVVSPGAKSLNAFAAPDVTDAAVEQFDDHGLGLEPNNLAAVGSLRIYRTLRWGKNVELFLTDHHSYRGPSPDTPEFTPEGLRWASSQKVAEILDAGRAYNNGNPPATIRFGGRDLPNPRKDSPPLSYLGSAQKKWLLRRLKESSARWKIWGHSFGTLDWRSDYQNLPASFPAWPVEGYNLSNGGYYSENGEIFDSVKSNAITGFAIVAGDRHSFWAGLPSKPLSQGPFEPVGVEFITGAISSATFFEVAAQVIEKSDPQRPLFIHDRPDGSVAPAMNMTALHGVRASLELAESGDERRARAKSNPEVAPHLKFLDLGGNGYSTVVVDRDFMEAEFVCIPWPLERSSSEDGGPVSYRVIHRAPLWAPGERPTLERRILEGNPPLAT